MKTCHPSWRTSGRFAAVFGLLLTSTFVAMAAVPAVVTFEELAQPGSYPIPNGYAGLQWNNFWHSDFQFSGDSGMINGVISPRRLAYNVYGDPASISASTTFNVASTYLTGVWNDGLNVQIRGFNGATVLYDNVFTIDSTAPSLINLNYYGITRLDFLAFGGISHGWRGVGGGGDGPVFCMDNFVLTPVPEPSHIALLGFGLLYMLVKTTRKRVIASK